VLDAAGIDPPQDRKLDGISLLPMIEGEMDRRPRPMAFELGHQRAYLDRPYKLFTSDGGKTFALYDLDQDPGEQNDIAAAHPDLVASMEQGLDRWRASCAASRETTTPSER
jgi:arylsulfatase A-like enzyme